MVNFYTTGKQNKAMQHQSPSLAAAGVFHVEVSPTSPRRTQQLATVPRPHHHHAEKQPLSVSPTPIADLKFRPPAIQPQ